MHLYIVHVACMGHTVAVYMACVHVPCSQLTKMNPSKIQLCVDVYGNVNILPATTTIWLSFVALPCHMYSTKSVAITKEEYM